MLETESKTATPGLPTVLSDCPQCDAELAVLSVISGRAGAEYWALQCTECNGIHLDIVQPPVHTASQP